MHHIATSPFLVKSTSPSNANVACAARLIRNLKMSIVKNMSYHCDLCIIAAVLLSILKVFCIITSLDCLCKIRNLQ